MKPITIETMNDYRYLSALASNNEYLFFVDTMADLKNNDYSQRLHRYCIDSKEDKVIFEGKRADYAVLKDGRLLIRNNEKSDFIETSFAPMGTAADKQRYPHADAVGNVVKLDGSIIHRRFLPMAGSVGFLRRCRALFLTILP